MLRRLHQRNEHNKIMKTNKARFLKLINGVLPIVASVLLGAGCATAQPAKDPLPAWNDGGAKQAIEKFVQTTTDPASKDFVPAPERIATFDQDGTLWVEHPMYSQVMYCLERVPALVKAKPELAKVAPFSTVLELLHGDRAAMEKLNMEDLMKILAATSTGISTEQFQAEVKQWLAEAKDPRWHKAYNELTYLPMQEVLTYLRASGYKTYIVTGGGQDFVRVYSEQTYGIPPEQVVGTMIGRRPQAAFGNSTGDQQMLEYTKAGDGARLAMLVLHDDAVREYAYGPAQGLPDTKVGTFTQALYDKAQKDGWIVISMKDDWKQIFAFENK